MSRFEDVEGQYYNMLENIISEHFPELASAHIKLLYDTKFSKGGGKFRIAYIKTSNELIRFFSSDNEAVRGVDYIIFIQKQTFQNITDEDRIRILRHELRHTHVNFDSESNPYRVRPHEIEDFYDEVRINESEGELNWRERVGAIGLSLMEREKEAKKGKGRGRRRRAN